MLGDPPSDPLEPTARRPPGRARRGKAPRLRCTRSRCRPGGGALSRNEDRRLCCERGRRSRRSGCLACQRFTTQRPLRSTVLPLAPQSHACRHAATPSRCKSSCAGLHTAETTKCTQPGAGWHTSITSRPWTSRVSRHGSLIGRAEIRARCAERITRDECAHSLTTAVRMIVCSCYAMSDTAERAPVCHDVRPPEPELRVHGAHRALERRVGGGSHGDDR